MSAEPTTGVTARRPRGLVVGLLVAVAVLAVVIVVFVIWMTTHVVQVGTDNTPRLTVGEVEHSSGIDLPEDAVVLENTRTIEVFTAQVELPSGELPDFAEAGYSPVDEPSVELQDELGSATSSEFYTGENEDRVGSVAVVDDGGTTVLYIDVRTTPYTVR
jgi:hypothetical protein